MSNNYFCPHCGAKTTYESSIPAYCFSCGQGLRSASQPSSKASQSHDSEDDDDDEESYKPLRINKKELAKDWSIDIPKQKIGIGSFQDLAINQSAPRSNLAPREAPKDIQNLNGKDLLKAVRQECAKPKSSREIG